MKMSARDARVLLLGVLMTAMPALLGAAAADPPPPLVLVLDASGSMWGRIGGDSKIEVARRVLDEVVVGLPDESRTALVAYGHRREGDCADVETVIPLGPLERDRLLGAVQALNPKGKTPLTDAVEQAFGIAAGAGAATTVVLISDGLETCGGDPCGAVRATRDSGVDFVLHVVGFGISEDDVSSLECAAQAGGGLYFNAESGTQLAAALQQAVEPAPPAAATLAVRAVRNGEPCDAAVRVSSGDMDVAAGRTYLGAETNPRRFALPAGTYDVEVRPLGIQGAAPVRFDSLVLADGASEERTADFSSAEIAVKVTRNGALSDAVVKVFPAGTGRQVAGGRTYTSASSNPRRLTVTPGVWDVEAGSVEIAGSPVQRWESVKVAAGELAELEHEFRSGILRIGATANGALVDAIVSVREAAGGREVAGGRTYTSAGSNPKQLVVTPGAYTVRVRPVRLPGVEERLVEIEVTAGATVEHSVDFGTGG